MIKVAISANQVIHYQPDDGKKNNADIKPGTNYKSLVYDIFSYKIKTDPGKNGCYAIA
jgi:hypothetical protein